MIGGMRSDHHGLIKKQISIENIKITTNINKWT